MKVARIVPIPVARLREDPHLIAASLTHGGPRGLHPGCSQVTCLRRLRMVKQAFKDRFVPVGAFGSMFRCGASWGRIRGWGVGL
ncbi:hypothetical protein GCM10015535_28120 [Streptomyces gelaticus]|uniref:Uncharacterized protein n=1 Tax=Streptomyces gelaticus TaxID=285446 RepID=A0ABQ2VXL5_9ACTN|nr:hypothetical protein GCM10015535_28120 [Streptomyces gelaticus]